MIPFTILHISDLHQDLLDEIPYSWLVDSLKKDIFQIRDGVRTVAAPSICVVSGDIVYGVKPNSPDAAAELARQYREAYRFLTGLCDQLFDGDRNRIVILPGNHDVDYGAFLKSGSYISVPDLPDEKSRLVRELFEPNSRLRWSWPRMEFFRISNMDQYQDRILEFSKFYEEFYDGQRKYSLDPNFQYDVFDFPELSFSILALNSCYNNDPMNRVASINPQALAAACREITEPSRVGWVFAASWHHDVSGGILHEDFLDANFLQLLIDAGVTLGLHGHRHRSSCFEQRNRLGDTKRNMAVVAAATLCAGPVNLSPGVPRGYNVIEIDAQKMIGHVHLRRMINQIQNLPVWGPDHFIETNHSSMAFKLDPPKLQRPVGLDRQLALESAANNFALKKWEAVLEDLKPYDEDPYARKMIIDALREIGDDSTIISKIHNPSSISEAVILGTSILESGKIDNYSYFKSLDIVKNSSDSSIKEISKRLEMRFKNG